jgi:hypothetical protein
MTAVSKKSRIITRSRYRRTDLLRQGKWHGEPQEPEVRRQSRIYFANALRTTRSTYQRWIGFSEDDAKRIRRRRDIDIRKLRLPHSKENSAERPARPG